MGRIKEYLVRVWFKRGFINVFWYLLRPYTIKWHKTTRDSVYIDIAAKTCHPFKSKAWEEDIINYVLDNFEGTDMKGIERIEY